MAKGTILASQPPGIRRMSVNTNDRDRVTYACFGNPTTPT